MWYTLGDHLRHSADDGFPKLAGTLRCRSLCDLLMITGVVYATGAQDSYFISLVPAGDFDGSILFSRAECVSCSGSEFCIAVRDAWRAHVITD